MTLGSNYASKSPPPPIPANQFSKVQVHILVYGLPGVQIKMKMRLLKQNALIHNTTLVIILRYTHFCAKNEGLVRVWLLLKWSNILSTLMLPIYTHIRGVPLGRLK